MRRLLLLLFAWLCVFTIGPVAAANRPVARPTAVIAKLTLGEPSGLDGVRAFANAIQPGIGGMVDSRLLLTGIGARADGLDLTGAIHVLYVDLGTTRGYVTFARVSDASLLAPGSVVKAGWALVGDPALVKAAGAWPHGALTGGVPPDLIMTAYPDAVLKQRAAEIQAVQTTVGGMRGTLAGDALAIVLDGMVAAAADTVSLTLRLDASADRIAATMALVPRGKSKLATFVKAQRPSDFRLLDSLAAGPSPYLVCGALTLGPYRSAGLALAATVFSALGPSAQGPALAQLFGGLTGEAAAAMTMDAKQGPIMRALYETSDPRGTEAAIAALHGAMAAPHVVTIAGMTTTSRAVPGVVVHDGVQVRAYDTTTTPTTFGTGTQRGHVAVTDHHLVVVTDGNAPRSIDAARGKGTRLSLTPVQRELIERARARKDSFAMTFDASAMFAAAPMPVPIRIPAGSDFLVTVGFANRALELHVAVPTAFFRALIRGAMSGTP